MPLAARSHGKARRVVSSPQALGQRACAAQDHVLHLPVSSATMDDAGHLGTRSRRVAEVDSRNVVVGLQTTPWWADPDTHQQRFGVYAFLFRLEIPF